LNTKNIYVKDIRAGDRVSDVFLVMEKNLAMSQKGNPYLSLKLRDITGEVDGRVWDRATEMNNIFQTGDIIHIQSNAVNFRDVIQLSITKINIVDDPAITRLITCRHQHWTVPKCLNLSWAS